MGRAKSKTLSVRGSLGTSGIRTEAKRKRGGASDFSSGRSISTPRWQTTTTTESKHQHIKYSRMTQIYAYGSNGNGQLGVGHQLDVSTPKNVLIDITDNIQPIAIRAGGNHTLILTSDGQLYSSGDPSKGARGLTPAEGFSHNKFTPVILSAPDELPLQVTLCAATWEASIIVAKDAEGRSTKLYTFGTGEKGELGQGHLIFRSAKAGLIRNFPPAGIEIVGLSACMNHVVVVLDNGEVFGWGNGRKGQLGEPTGIIYEPRKIAHDLIHPSVTCGKDFTLVSVPATGDYKLLGSDRHDIKKALPPPKSSTAPMPSPTVR